MLYISGGRTILYNQGIAHLIPLAYLFAHNHGLSGISKRILYCSRCFAAETQEWQVNTWVEYLIA